MGFYKTRRGRPSRREQISQFNASHRFYAGASERPDAVERCERELVIPEPPLRHRVRRPVDGKPAVPLEKEVLAAALKALRADPRVAFADRQQSGLFQDGDRFIRVGAPGKLDVIGMLKGGRYFEFEAKRPGEKPDERQSLRIAFVKSMGGISGFFTSAEESLALLP